MHTNFNLTPIALAKTDFKQKFAIPRQSGLVDNIAYIEMLEPYNRIESLAGLEEFSYIWLIFGFHKSIQHKTTYKTQINPPKYPKDKKVGVFATRSPHRPNNLGLSLVKLLKIELNSKRICLIVQSADLLDQTPIFDIKPYLPSLEAKPKSKCYISPNSTKTYKVKFNKVAQQVLRKQKHTYLKRIIVQTLSLDPRPKNQLENFDKIYSANIADYDIKFIFKKSMFNYLYIEVIDLIFSK